jgi:hypothetical protein
MNAQQHNWPKPYSPETLAERTDRRGADECWLWTGQRNHAGYGLIRARGNPRRNLRVTHITLEEAGFPRPEGAHALHSCDNPGCVNPGHLRWGTRAENTADRVSRGRTHRAFGETAAMAVLTEGIVREIRESSERSSVLSRRLGVAESTVGRVRHRKTWGHVE